MITDGKVDISVLCDNGQSLILDTLSTGSNMFAYSLLGLASTMFDVRAKTPVTVLSINSDDLRLYRDTLPALNSKLKETEQYINEYGVPIIDWQEKEIANSDSIERFKRSVDRISVLNEFEKKKETPFTNLVANVKKQIAEEQKEELKIKKKQRYKRNLGKLLRTYIKAKMPSTTESIVYLMEVFKFVNR